MKKTLWRAAQDDYVDTGYSFAESREDAEAYLDNPGFGGAHLYRTRVELPEGTVVDLTSKTVRQITRSFGLSDPGAIGLDEWLPRTPNALDALRAKGFLWALVTESYPADSTTWIWLGAGADDEPVLEEVPR